MTIKEVIKILDPETSLDALLEYEDEERIEAVDEACMVAVSALRAKRAPAKLDRSRWEGCACCTLPGQLRAREKHGYLYCEHCGRPITEEAWADLERRINDGTTD